MSEKGLVRLAPMLLHKYNTLKYQICQIINSLSIQDLIKIRGELTLTKFGAEQVKQICHYLNEAQDGGALSQKCLPPRQICKVEVNKTDNFKCYQQKYNCLVPDRLGTGIIPK